MQTDIARKNDITKIIRNIERMNGRVDNYVNEKSRIICELNDAQDYLDKKAEITNILDELQKKSQAKTKLIYENLLTKLIHEVKGYDDENHHLLLSTKMKNSRPWLDVEIKSKTGHVRDVYLDKGGSIENIAAMGLRFITISRTSNRRIILFDEADKDLNSKYIPNIARILHQLSKQIGMQVIYISHHAPSNFDGYARIIHLSRENGAIVSEVVSDISNEECFETSKDTATFMDESIGIKYIRLTNVKQHENTLIEFSPFVNIITGDNDIGKSTIIQAIDAVNRNQGRVGLIRDNKTFCRVELGLEDGMNIEWSYKKKGIKKTQYILTDDENVIVQKSDSGSAVPEWLNSYLAMPLYKDFDLHINDQHNASFILDSKISGHKRAEILSLGKTTNHVLAMIKTHNLEIDRLTKKTTRLKKELKDVKNRLEAFRQLQNINQMLNEIIEKSQNIENVEAEILVKKQILLKATKVTTLNNTYTKTNMLQAIHIPKTDFLGYKKILIDKYRKNIDKKDILQKINTSTLLIAPTIKNNQKILSLGKKINAFTQKNATFNKIENIKKILIPEIEFKKDNNKIISKYEKSILKNNTLKNLPLLITKTITTENIGNIKTFGEKIKKYKDKISNYNQEIKNSEQDIEKYLEEKERFLDILGEECPICGNHIKKGHKDEL